MQKKIRAFTLVEIMIVVAIIGLLAAIAIPNLLRARVNANDNSIQGDLRAFSTASESYRAAQNPPQYAPGLGPLTTAVPAYLDPTWTEGGTKHGHTINYTVPAGGATYSLRASAIANQAATHFCIDESGVLRTAPGTAAAPAAANTCPPASWTAVST